jgi:DNA topoisomerase VI subunit B
MGIGISEDSANGADSERHGHGLCDGRCINGNLTMSTLQRTTFETSRLLEFFSEKELAMQIGFPMPAWPIALLKELIDNALDASETAGILPKIEVTLEPDVLSVQDNGPGLPVATLERSLDYLLRVSDKAHYVSPSRGQLGNALKTVWAAPYVARGEAGAVEVTTGGITHRIAVSLDRIAQQPDLRHLTQPDGVVKNGTLVKLIWSGIASFLDSDADTDFYKSAHTLVREYAAFNPYGHFVYREPKADVEHVFNRTTDDWRKWTPHDPTSAHWYTDERLRGLIAAYVADERRGGRARTVREVVAEFSGLSGSTKPKVVTHAAGLERAYLHDLVEQGDVALDRVRPLLAAMQEASRPVKPAALGVLGEAHVRAHLIREWTEPDSIKYRKVDGYLDHGMPVVLELAFGWRTEECETEGRRIIAGINWTPSIKFPFLELPSWLGEQRVDADDPVMFFVHVAMPRPHFSDRGKSLMALPPRVRSEIAKGMVFITKHWKTMKRQADKDDRVRARQLEEYLKRQRPTVLSVKAAAYQVMEQAYFEASAQGRLPANARQVMYAARPKVLALTGDKIWQHSSYFTQVLLPDFMTTDPERTASWDVVFDDRGHLIEPHTQRRIGLGTLAVRRYIATWHTDVPRELGDFTLDHAAETAGPGNRYHFALFIEKEGFDALLEAAQIASRYDVAVFSTKGQTVTASRALVEALSAKHVTILVVHDFDKYGIEILHTLRTNTRRYTYQSAPNVIDLGLRLGDVEGLERERVEYKKAKHSPAINLRECGATEEECAFLVRREQGQWVGDRVELNAMPSDQFITWLEGKLAEVGVEKVVPDADTLADAYRLAVRKWKLQQAIDDALGTIDEEDDAPVPDDLAEQIRAKISGTALAWDEAIWSLMEDTDGGGDF